MMKIIIRNQASPLLLFTFIFGVVTGAWSLNCTYPEDKMKCSCDKSKRGRLITIQCNGTDAANDIMISTVDEMLKGAPNTSEINVFIKSPGLEPIPDNSFMYSNIKKLTIIESSLTNLSKDALVKLKDTLTFLSLNDNNLTKVPVENLKHLINLKTLYLAGNFIEEIKYTDFFYNKNLTILDLSRNRIIVVEDKSFSNLVQLKTLNLLNNYLSSVTKETFYNLRSLKSLDLTGNNLTVLSEDLLYYLPLLQHLTAAGNNFKSLDVVKIKSSGLIKLSLINCSINGPIERHHLKEIPNLTTLDLSYNPIKEIKSYAFSEFFDLTFLRLNYCQLTLIDKTALKNLTKLKELELNHNFLPMLECDHTSDLEKLQKMELFDNKLKSIQSGTFLSSHNLVHLNLTNNDLHCDCNLFDFAKYLNKSVIREVNNIVCSSPFNLISTSIVHVNFDSMSCKQNVSTCLDSDVITTTVQPSSTKGSSPLFNVTFLEINSNNNDRIEVIWNFEKLNYVADGMYQCNLSNFDYVNNKFFDSLIDNCTSFNDLSKNFSADIPLRPGVNKYNVCIVIYHVKNKSVYDKFCISESLIKNSTIIPFLPFTNTTRRTFPSTFSTNSDISSSLTPSPVSTMNTTDSFVSSSIKTSTDLATLYTTKPQPKSPIIQVVEIDPSTINVTLSLSESVPKHNCMLRITVFNNKQRKTSHIRSKNKCKNVSEIFTNMTIGEHRICVSKLYNGNKNDTFCVSINLPLSTSTKLTSPVATSHEPYTSPKSTSVILTSDRTSATTPTESILYTTPELTSRGLTSHATSELTTTETSYTTAELTSTGLTSLPKSPIIQVMEISPLTVNVTISLSESVPEDNCSLLITVINNNQRSHVRKRKQCGNRSEFFSGLKPGENQICVSKLYNSNKNNTFCVSINLTLSTSTKLTSPVTTSYKPYTSKLMLPVTTSYKPHTSELTSTESTLSDFTIPDKPHTSELTSTESTLSDFTIPDKPDSSTETSQPSSIFLSIQEDKPVVLWNLTKEESQSICKLQLSIYVHENEFWTSPMKVCSNGSYNLDDLEMGKLYNICVSLLYNHVTREKQCIPMATISPPSLATQNSSSTKFPVVALVGLLILALLIIIVIIVVIIKMLLFRRIKSDAYYVAKEEEESYKRRSKRQSNVYSVSSIEECDPL